MVERYPLTVHVPIKGKLLLRIDGVPGEHEVGEFTQTILVAFTPGPGEASFQFDSGFWKKAVQRKDPEPEKSTHDIIKEELDRHGVDWSDGMATRICDALGREGRLSA